MIRLTEVKPEIENSSDVMIKEREIQTSIRVPESKYTLLEELKRIDDKSINALVVEAITLLIKNRKKEIESQLHNRTDKVTDALSKLQ